MGEAINLPLAVARTDSAKSLSLQSASSAFQWHQNVGSNVVMFPLQVGGDGYQIYQD